MPNIRHRRFLFAAPLAFLVLILVRCVSWRDPRQWPDAIEVAGYTQQIGTPVIRWHQPDGYDAYRTGPWFDRTAPLDGKRRYAVRAGLPPELAAKAATSALDLADLQQVVHQFVLHFDVCGTARRCFHVLHDARHLSVHFLLDVDGTIYQTLDLREKAHHATIANDGSIGVEIAHPGTFAQPLSADMRRWYERDEQGWRMKFLPGRIEPGVRTPDFVPRPDRPEFITGTIHGKTYHQFDFTPQQYEALAHLCAGLSAVFPRIRLEAPRDAAGTVRQTQLSAEELRAFDGVVGHFHVQKNKTDPGPALQWDRLLERARALRAELSPP